MEGEVADPRVAAEVRTCGLSASGLEPEFDRLARVAASGTRSVAAVLAFEGTERSVKGFFGRDFSANTALLRPLQARLLASTLDLLTEGKTAGALVRGPSGVAVGTLCVHGRAGRGWTDAELEALVDTARLVERELALRAAQRPDSWAERILESISDACVFLDGKWNYTYLNRRAGEIFGRKPADLVGKHIWTEFPQGVGQKFYHAYHKALAEQTPIRIEEYYPPYDRWFENRIYPSKDGLAIFFQDVTERRKNEQERRCLVEVVAATSDVVAMADHAGDIVYLNPAGRTLLALAPDAPLRGLQLGTLHGPASREALHETAIPTAKRTGRWSGESTLVDASGHETDVSAVLLWHEGARAEEGFLALVARDITESKAREQESRRQAEVYAQAEQMAHVGFWTWRIASNRIAWSEELRRMYAIDPGQTEASFENYLERVHPRDRDHARSTVEQALRDHGAFTFENRIVLPDRSVRYLHTWGRVVVDGEGQATEVFGTCLDMTELIETAKSLRRSEEWLSVALEGARVVVWDWDVHADEIAWSEGVERVLGLAPGTFDRKFGTYLSLVHPDDRERVERTLHECVMSGDDPDIEHRIVAPDGTVHWVDGRGRVFRDGSGRPIRIAGTVVDITARKRADEERKQLVEQLRNAQRVETVGRMAAGAAHDFNNVLTVVSLANDALRLQPQPAATRESVEQIAGACKRGAGLTRQMLAFGRSQGARPVELDLSELVDNSAKLLYRVLPEGIKVETRLARGLPPVFADRAHMEQTLLNLIFNACDAMPDGGSVTVSTYATDDAVALEVSDTGVGMTPEVEQRIFEPFFTTKPPGYGTGLGLPTTRDIVEQYGGTIRVKSRPGAGSTFTLLVPRATQPPSARPESVQRRAPVAVHAPSAVVLLVEQDEALRMLIARALSRNGYRALAVADPHEAVSMSASRAIGPDLLLVGATLPSMSSQELVKRVREGHTATKVLSVAGALQGQAHASDGAEMLLQMPFGEDALLARVREALGESPS